MLRRDWPPGRLLVEEEACLLANANPGALTVLTSGVPGALPVLVPVVPAEALTERFSRSIVLGREANVAVSVTEPIVN